MGLGRTGPTSGGWAGVEVRLSLDRLVDCSTDVEPNTSVRTPRVSLTMSLGARRSAPAAIRRGAPASRTCRAGAEHRGYMMCPRLRAGCCGIHTLSVCRRIVGEARVAGVRVRADMKMLAVWVGCVNVFGQFLGRLSAGRRFGAAPTSSASSKPDLDHPPRWRSRAEQHDEWVRNAPLHATGTLRQKQTPSTQPRPRPQLRGGPLNTSPGRIESTKSTLNEQQTRTSPHGTSARTGTTWDQRSEQRRST